MNDLDTKWKTLPIGAGGWLTGIDVAPDNTIVVRTDTYGAYTWNGVQWQQLVTSESLPVDQLSVEHQGVYEIKIAPSNTNIFYMNYLGKVYRSDNRGDSWVETSFDHAASDPNDAYRMNSHKMAVDPLNSDVVYVGTASSGLFVTFDGGKEWSRVDVPISTEVGGGQNPGMTGLAFDSHSEIVNGRTSTLYAASNGHGVYASIDGGETWSKLEGGPSIVKSAVVSERGIYYAVDGTSLWSHQDGVWKEVVSEPTNGIHSVAIDPFDPLHMVVASPAGFLNQTRDGGITWSGINFGTRLTASDVPWLAETGQYMSVGGIAFDQHVPDKLWMSAGVGVWHASMPQTMLWDTPINWHSQSTGIEQLVANEIVVPLGGVPIVASWDRPVFAVDSLTDYPSKTGISDFAMGWSVDYAASDPKFLAVIADWWGVEKSGYSEDGGATWHPFEGMPKNALSSIGGTIAVSTPHNIIWAPANGFAPAYTKDGGVTWSELKLPQVSDWSDFHFAYYLDKTTVTADKVVPNTFYLYYNGVYKSIDGGESWTRVFEGQISDWSMYNSKLQAVPGNAGHLYFTGGHQSGEDPADQGLYHSEDGGVTWTAAADVLEVSCFGFGKAADVGDYPAIFIVGWVKGEYGIWQSDDSARTWVQIGEYPTGSLDFIKTIAGDPNVYGRVYVGFNGSGYAYLPGGDNSSAPTSPTIVGFSRDTNIEGDGVTAASTLVLSGSASAGAIVKIYDGATLIKTLVADSSGAWSATTTTLADATHSFTAIAIDGAGNLSGVSAPLQVTVDTIAPARPVITSLVANDQNVAGALTNSECITVIGTAEAGSVVTILNGTKVIGQATASVDGSFNFTASLPDGANSLTAKATDLAGNTSATAVAVSVKIDATPPAQPKIISYTDSGIVGDGITKATTLKLSGTAEAKALVMVYDGNTLLGETVASSKGLWSFTPGALLDGNTYDFQVTASDSARNTSILSDLVSVTIDSTAPLMPQIVAYTPGNPVLGVTKSNVITLTGTAEADATIKLYNGSKYMGVTVADDTGAWSFTTGILSNATYRFAATATDAAGNTSPLATFVGSGAARSAPLQDNSVMVVTVDTMAPKQPSLTSFSTDTGKVGDRVTADSTLDLVGKAEAGSTVDIFAGDTHLGSTVAGSNGAWTFFAGDLQDGLHNFVFKATDIAGNTSVGSRPFQITIDTEIDAPVILKILPDTAIADDFVTKASVLTLQGTSEAYSQVSVFSGETLLGVAKANGQGAWTFKTKKLPDGEHSFSVAATDQAGNESGHSGAVVVKIDTTAPSVPAFTSHAIVGDTLTLQGTAGADDLITIYEGRSALGTVSADSSGHWNFTTGDLSPAKHTLYGAVSDLAGNTAKSGTLTVLMSKQTQYGPEASSSESSLHFSDQMTKHETWNEVLSGLDLLDMSEFRQLVQFDVLNGTFSVQQDGSHLSEMYQNSFLL